MKAKIVGVVVSAFLFGGTAIAAQPARHCSKPCPVCPTAQVKTGDDAFGRVNLQAESDFKSVGFGWIVITNGFKALRYEGQAVSTTEAINQNSGLPDLVRYTLDAGTNGTVRAIGYPDRWTYAPINDEGCAYSLDVPVAIQQGSSWLRLPNGKVKRPSGQLLVRVSGDVCTGYEQAEIVEGDVHGLAY